MGDVLSERTVCSHHGRPRIPARNLLHLYQGSFHTHPPCRWSLQEESKDRQLAVTLFASRTIVLIEVPGQKHPFPSPAPLESRGYPPTAASRRGVQSLGGLPEHSEIRK